MNNDVFTAPPAPKGPTRAGLLTPGRRVPAPVPGEPTDDDLLRYLDGALDADAREAVRRKLERSPGAAARLEILSAALAENGWPTDDDDSESDA